MTTALLLELAAGAASDRVAVGAHGCGMSYADLHAASERVAQTLVERGARRLVLLDVNSEVLPVCLFAAGLAGVPFAPVNFRLAPDQLRALGIRLAPAVVVIADDHRSLLDGIEGLDLMSPKEILDVAPDPAVELPPVDGEDIAVLLFTSGTTGEPKAAVLRHRHLTAYILGSVELVGAEESEAQLISVPGYHIAGISSVLSNVFSARRIVYLSTFDPDEWIDVVDSQQVTHAMVVPTMLSRILDRVESGRGSLASLRHLAYGGGRMPLETIERALALLPSASFVNAYGLTETSSTISVLGPDDHRAAAASDDPAIRARLTSVGQPLPTVEVEVRGPDGSMVATGSSGEIYVRGEQVAGEYLGRSLLDEEGWLPTNDSGRVDGDGFLYLEGRLDDVIVRGAENLSPGEIEDVLLEHPLVTEAAVVGIPDPEWGETVGAAVVLTEGSEADPEDLQDWVRNRLRSARTPTVLQIRDALPYNEMGKLLRRVLREDLSSSS